MHARIECVFVIGRIMIPIDFHASVLTYACEYVTLCGKRTVQIELRLGPQEEKLPWII